MKKLIAVILAVVMCLSLGTAAFAAEDILLISPAPASGVNVTVTIADAGELVLVQAPVYVIDADGDGAVTINDALIAAHAAYHTDGTDGYVYYSGDYGLAMDRLWGVENGGSYMYYVNDLMPLSLGEAVNEGDRITAYGFADLEFWTDTYSFFDKSTAAVKAGESLELVLSTPDWEGNILPAAGAVIYVDGVATESVTDENGKAVVSFDKAGKYTVSAKSDTMTLVPPVCTVKVGYVDVAADDECAAAVDYLVEKGLLTGIADDKFEPAGEASRAMVIAMLHKSVGSPSAPADFDAALDDIDGTSFDAFNWAAYEGIIEGYGNGKAAPLNNVTRQELAVILWRFAKSLDIDVSVGENTNILSYNDALEIKNWAIPAMQWACGVGLFEADAAGNILPKAGVTRGELAQYVYELATLIG